MGRRLTLDTEKGSLEPGANRLVRGEYHGKIPVWAWICRRPPAPPPRAFCLLLLIHTAYSSLASKSRDRPHFYLTAAMTSMWNCEPFWSVSYWLPLRLPLPDNIQERSLMSSILIPWDYGERTPYILEASFNHISYTFIPDCASFWCNFPYWQTVASFDSLPRCLPCLWREMVSKPRAMPSCRHFQFLRPLWSQLKEWCWGLNMCWEEN